MTLVCPNQNWFDARAARLTLVREEAEGGVELFAYLTLDTADDDMDVETGRLFVPYGHPLERAAANINGDDSLLQRFNDRLLSTFPSACACPSEEPCEALGTQDELRAALSEFVV